MSDKYSIVKDTKTLRQLNDDLRKNIEIHDAEKYYEGYIDALEYIRKGFACTGIKNLSVNKLVKRTMPREIEWAKEERDEAIEEIKNKNYDEDCLGY